MQLSMTTVLTVLAAAATALPGAITPRQSTFTELAIWGTSGCKTGSRTGTVNIVDSTECQNFPAGIVAAVVDIDIPAGCSSKFYWSSGRGLMMEG